MSFRTLLRHWVFQKHVPYICLQVALSKDKLFQSSLTSPKQVQYSNTHDRAVIAMSHKGIKSLLLYRSIRRHNKKEEERKGIQPAVNIYTQQLLHNYIADLSANLISSSTTDKHTSSCPHQQTHKSNASLPHSTNEASSDP